MARLRLLTVSSFLLALVTLSSCGGELKTQIAGQLNTPVECGTLQKVITESSGLIKSRRYPDKDIFWTHNDSGAKAFIYAIDSRGSLLREVKIPKSDNDDWEEISMDEQGRLIIFDTGNSKKDQRTVVTLYRIAEPDALNQEEKIEKPEKFHFKFPEGIAWLDSEGGFVRGGNAYIFSKEKSGVRCFRLPLPETAPGKDVVVEMIPVTETSTFSIVTGAALSSDAKHLAIINYLSIMVIDLPESFDALTEKTNQISIFTYPRRLLLSHLGQQEAVAWDGEDLLLTTENGKVFRISKALNAR